MNLLNALTTVLCVLMGLQNQAMLRKGSVLANWLEEKGYLDEQIADSVLWLIGELDKGESFLEPLVDEAVVYLTRHLNKKDKKKLIEIANRLYQEGTPQCGENSDNKVEVFFKELWGIELTP